MGTIVQTPERTAVEIGGLTAIEKQAEGGGGLGAFLEGILPAVNTELETYDKESRARVMALGQNDKLNNVMNEVSILDRQNYAHGRNYQQVVNGQILLAQKFQEQVYNADPDTFEPEELLKQGREFTNQSVNNIHDSALPSDIKEALYNAQLKENATYMKAVDAKIKQVTGDNISKTRTNAAAELTRNLREGSYTAEERTVLLDTFFDKDSLYQRSLNQEATADEIATQSNATVGSVLKFILADIEVTGQPDDLVKLDQVIELSEQLVPRDLELAMQVKDKALKISADIRKNQNARRDYNTNNFLNARITDPTLWDNVDATKEYVNGLFLDSSIDFETRVSLSNQVWDAHTKYQEKLLNAEVVADPLSSSPSEYEAMGKTAGNWEDDSIASFIKTEPNNPALGYIKAMDYFSKHAEYTSGGMKKASTGFFRTLTGYARMSDQEVANDQFADMRKEQFAIMSSMYQRAKGQNMSRAYDLLSGVEPEYVDAFSAAFETGKTLEDVREMFKNPVSTQQRYANIERVLADSGGIQKALNLGNEGFGGHDGQGRASMSDGLEPQYGEIVSMHMGSQKAYYASTAPISTPTGLVTAFNNAGGLVKSTNGLSSIVMDLGVAKQVNNWTVSGSKQKLSTEYFARAVDIERLRLSEVHGTDMANIIAYSDGTGQQMYFDVYESGGFITGKKEPKKKFSGAVLMGNIKVDAERIHSADSKRKATPAAQDSKNMAIVIGQANIVDVNGRQSTNKVNALYARAMGDNLYAATRWVNHMGEMEGFSVNGTATKDANSGRKSFVYGHGMTVDTLTRMGMLKEVQAARGNTQLMLNLQGRFAQKYYANIGTDLKRVGIPKPTSAEYPAKFIPSMMLIYDVSWHAGNTNGLAKAMNAKSYAQGRRILQGLSTYNRKNLGSKRNRFMESALQSHFRLRGVK